MSVGIGRTLIAPRLRHPTNFRIDPKIIQLSVWQSLPPAIAVGLRADPADQLSQSARGLRAKSTAHETIGASLDLDAKIAAGDRHRHGYSVRCQTVPNPDFPHKPQPYRTPSLRVQGSP
jgi:hypothetical protein